MTDYMIVGLGNPGEQYEHTRHNAGFRAIDELAGELDVRYWKNECGALVAHAVRDSHELILAKPQGFMNVSGGPVKKLLAAYEVSPEHLIVIHDELDIPSGSVKVKFGGGHAGHNGLRSICDKLGTCECFRVRCGIGRPPGRMDVASYVLSVPRGAQADEFDQAVHTSARAVLSLVEVGLEKTQQVFNG